MSLQNNGSLFFEIKVWDIIETIWVLEQWAVPTTVPKDNLADLLALDRNTILRHKAHFSNHLQHSTQHSFEFKLDTALTQQAKSKNSSTRILIDLLT